MHSSRLEFWERLTRCFEEDELQILVTGTTSPAVKVVHRPTGIETTCDQHNSQIFNRSQAALDLLQRLFRESVAEDPVA